MLTFAEVLKFKSASEENDKLYRMMVEPEEPIEGLGPLPDKRFERIALKILTYFIRLERTVA